MSRQQTRVPPIRGIIQVWFQPLQWKSGTICMKTGWSTMRQEMTVPMVIR